MMTEEAFAREQAYQAVMHISRNMLKQGIIDASDYEKIKRLMLDKFQPLIGQVIDQTT